MIHRCTSLEEALKKLGYASKEARQAAVGGGSIHQAQRLDFRGKPSLFIKSNHSSSAAMFETEAQGLSAMAAVFPLGVPQPLALVANEFTSMLILPWIEQGRPGASFWADFGRALAEMHLSGGADHYGYSWDNYIGSTPQSNSPCPTWLEFFRDKRLGVQGKLALKRGLFSGEDYQRLENLMSRLNRWLFEPKFPQPLHGDLWSGNYLAGADGRAWLIDPAFYFGHGEADLAMTEMFGSMARPFYDAYREIIPDDGLYKERREIYNLYHYINHLNLFGHSYYGSCMDIIRRYS